MELVEEIETYHVWSSKQPHFPATETKFQVKHRMECGLVLLCA